MHFTTNIHIHSLDMQIGKSGKPQCILIIVHGGMPRYLKPSKSVDLMRWVEAFHKVSNALERKAALAGQGSPEEEKTEAIGEKHDVANRENKPKRSHEDSGIESEPATPRCSAMSSQVLEEEEEDEKKGQETGVDTGIDTTAADAAAVQLLPTVIEMDISEFDHDGAVEGEEGETAGHEGSYRRSRMVLNKDRYEEQFVGSSTKSTYDALLKPTGGDFEVIAEEEENKKPEAAPRTLPTLQEIRQNIVTMRLSTWPNPPAKTGEPDYDRLLIKKQRQPSGPEDTAAIAEGLHPSIPPKPIKRNASVAGWKTASRAQDIARQLEGRSLPIGVASRNSLLRHIKTAVRPKRESRDVGNGEEGTEETERDDRPDEDPEAQVDPPYDRLSNYRKRSLVEAEPDEKSVEEGSAPSEEVCVPSDNYRARLATKTLIDKRPLPQPNQETDWKDIGNIQYEQSCQTIRVCMEKADINNTLALVVINGGVWVAGWKKELSEKLYGKLHVGDRLAQVNDMLVHDCESAHTFIRSSAKEEIVLVLSRLPHASIKSLCKATDVKSWGLDVSKNEVKGVGGPALAGGINLRTTGAISGKSCEWIVTELANQRVPIAKCPHDEVKQRLEKLSTETNLVVVLQPKDFVQELREGLRRLKHPSQYYCV
ncbi:uncharacterized protein [Diadema setosum]|uniref:uncharacterized protein n=1 Tax=Diadema setosum TaxID=31175 RepID=UPI003B3A9124